MAFAVLMLCASSSARAQKVLLIADDDAAGSAVLKTSLTGAGMTVTQTAIPSWQYDGTNPAPAGFDVILLLAGTANSRSNDMPAGGQTAILNFVNASGGLVETEWAAFQVSANRWQTLKPLVLLQRTGGTIGNIDYKVLMAFQNHALWTGLPATFSFSSATNIGSVIPGPGVVRVATSVAAGDAVVIRDVINNGRIVELSTAGNYTNGTWANANLQTLVANAVTWASKSRTNVAPVADPGGPYAVDEGGSVMLAGACADVDMDAQTLTWDFQGNNLFKDGSGPTPIFSAAGLSGPKVIPITLKCTDSGGLSDTKSTTVTVRDVPPVFTSMPPTVAREGSLYTYQATVGDPGAMDTLTCALKAGPMGMTVTGNSCKVSWLPTFDQARAGKQSVTITVADQNNSIGTQSFTIQTTFIDNDMDGLPDTWEMLYFGDLSQGPAGDPDKDGRPNLKEYLDGTDPTHYDGPNAPSVMTPDGGVHAPAKGLLVIADAIEPLGDPLQYEFQVYSDAQLQNLADVNINVLPGAGGQAKGMTGYSSGSLAEDRHYWWRARARDPYVAGPWSAVATFFADDVHEAPSAPAISMPLNQTKVKSTHPQLVVTNARSSDELALTYTFELYGDMGLTMLVENQAGIAETKGATSITVIKDLDPYHHYYWRAKATDSLMLDGPWSTVPSFQVVPTNSPPSPPDITSPKEGDRLRTMTPAIVLGGSSDPDDEMPIQYICDLDALMTFDSPAKQSSMAMLPADPMANQVMWTPQSLDEDKRYCVRCRAFDPSGTSGWSQTCFLIDVRNDPPTVPVLQNPSDGGMAAGDVVRFTWVNSLDPEGDAIHYEVEVFTDAGLTMRVSQGQGDDGPTGMTLVGLPPGELWWRARAVDAMGAASDWSGANHFSDAAVSIGGRGNMNGMGCGCAIGARQESRYNGLAMLVLAALFAPLRRRRSRR